MLRFKRPFAHLRLRPTLIVVAFIGAGLAATPFALSATENAAPAKLVTGLPSFAPLVKRVMPAVVNVSATLTAPQVSDSDQNQQGQQANPFQGFPPSPFDQFLKRFFGQQGLGQMHQSHPVYGVALGSGFIIDPSGYIVTNNHVIANANKITVIFQDGSKHPAKLIGHDPKTDLALLKINAPKPLPYVTWGNSNNEQVGDWVLAVGNPFGLGGTVSPGTIAARGRDIHEGPYDDFLQIDASINKGNSGGPSFNLAGQVIGINTAIYSPNGGSVGIGFAIPSNLAKPVIAQLREHGKVERGWLGVQIQTVTPALAKSLDLKKDEGALVSQVTPHSPAAKAGFKQGDVILSFDGHKIEKMRNLPIIVADTPIGSKAKVTVWRNGSTRQLDAVLGKLPANPQVAENSSSSVDGLHLSGLTHAWHQRLHVPDSVRGVVVTGVNDDSPFAQLGLERGDVIESINQKPVHTPSQAVAAIKAAHKSRNQHIMLLLNRKGVNEYVALSIQGNGNG